MGWADAIAGVVASDAETARVAVAVATAIRRANFIGAPRADSRVVAYPYLVGRK